MNKLLSVLLTGLITATLSMGAMAADASKPLTEGASAVTSTTASHAKTPAKTMHKSHKKHETQKAK